jgi:Na+/proline symporter
MFDLFSASHLHYLLVPMTALYLLLLAGLVRVVARGHALRTLMHHPALHVLGIGVSFGAWGLYVQPGVAYTMGFNYLSLFMGISALFMCAPILLGPILRLVKNHHLHSLPDLLAFRYNSRHIGQLATLFILCVYLPYISIQIGVIDRVVGAFGGNLLYSLIIYAMLVAFMLYLNTQIGMSEYRSNKPLMLVVAIQSIIKMSFLVVLAIVCIVVIFQGPDGFDRWLSADKARVQQLY